MPNFSNDNQVDVMYSPGLRRLNRHTTGEPPERFGYDTARLVTGSLLNVDGPAIPETYLDAANFSETKEWWKAMREEFDTLKI